MAAGCSTSGPTSVWGSARRGPFRPPRPGPRLGRAARPAGVGRGGRGQLGVPPGGGGQHPRGRARRGARLPTDHWYRDLGSPRTLLRVSRPALAVAPRPAGGPSDQVLHGRLEPTLKGGRSRPKRARAAESSSTNGRSNWGAGCRAPGRSAGPASRRGPSGSGTTRGRHAPAGRRRARRPRARRGAEGTGQARPQTSSSSQTATVAARAAMSSRWVQVCGTSGSPSTTRTVERVAAGLTTYWSR